MPQNSILRKTDTSICIRKEIPVPNEAYEEALTGFAEKILDAGKNPSFLEDFTDYFRRISFYGIFNSLAQTLLKMAAPGIPDFYQGSELWDLSFADPDNRRPVDYGERVRALAEIKAKGSQDRAGLIQGLLETPEDAKIKLFLIHR